MSYFLSKNKSYVILFILLVITFILIIISAFSHLIKIDDNKKAQLIICKGVFGIIFNIFIFFHIWLYKQTTKYSLINKNTNINMFVNFTILIYIINVIIFYYNMVDITNGFYLLYYKEKIDDNKYTLIKNLTESTLYIILFSLLTINYEAP